MILSSLVWLASFGPQSHAAIPAAAQPRELLATPLPAAGAAAALEAAPFLAAPMQEEGGWSFVLKPYLWAAGLDGNVGIGPVEVDVNAGISDLLDHLDVGAMLGFEAYPTDASWKLLSDVIYIDLSDNAKNADASVRELITELDIAYRLEGSSNVELLGGLRYWSLDTELEVGPLNPSKTESWVDPVVGVRGANALSDKWSLSWRGDIGGFGVGSDFSYQVFAAFTYAVGANSRLGLGWRHLSVDYEDDGFLYDTETTGPLLGFSWGF